MNTKQLKTVPIDEALVLADKRYLPKRPFQYSDLPRVGKLAYDYLTDTFNMFSAGFMTEFEAIEYYKVSLASIRWLYHIGVIERDALKYLTKAINIKREQVSNFKYKEVKEYE